MRQSVSLEMMHSQTDFGARPGAGRPTREQAKARQEELLERALDMFLDKGYELVTMEAIAAAVGMTKRTIYARYADKSALFKAVVQRAIERFIVPIERLQAAESDDLEATLAAIAHIRIENVMTPQGIRLQRILNAESYRFPEIFDMMTAQSTQPLIDFVADLLRRHADKGEIVLSEPDRAAAGFLSLAVGGPTRSAVSGAPIEPSELEARVRFSVQLFLNGVRPR